MRAGAHALALLATPWNASLLRALDRGPASLAELRRASGSPAASTLRRQLKRLTRLGVVVPDRRNSFPGTLLYELNAAGAGLRAVAASVEGWLERRPRPAPPIDSNAGRAAVRALADGWSSTMLRALAASPLALTELDTIISSLNYPSLDRRLAAMRLAGQVEAQADDGRRTPYSVTPWLRRGVAPVLAAAHWELNHREVVAGQPIGRLDLETAFMLISPLLRLPPSSSGSLRIVIESRRIRDKPVSELTMDVDTGKVVSCTNRGGGEPRAWLLGSAAGWLEALTVEDHEQLELTGKRDLARVFLTALNLTLFPPPGRDTLDSTPMIGEYKAN